MIKVVLAMAALAFILIGVTLHSNETSTPTGAALFVQQCAQIKSDTDAINATTAQRAQVDASDLAQRGALQTTLQTQVFARMRHEIQYDDEFIIYNGSVQQGTNTYALPTSLPTDSTNCE